MKRSSGKRRKRRHRGRNRQSRKVALFAKKVGAAMADSIRDLLGRESVMRKLFAITPVDPQNMTPPAP